MVQRSGERQRVGGQRVKGRVKGNILVIIIIISTARLLWSLLLLLLQDYYYHYHYHDRVRRVRLPLHHTGQGRAA